MCPQASRRASSEEGGARRLTSQAGQSITSAKLESAGELISQKRAKDSSSISFTLPQLGIGMASVAVALAAPSPAPATRSKAVNRIPDDILSDASLIAAVAVVSVHDFLA